MNETLTLYQTFDLLISATSQFDTIYNYWISGTFAVILSAFIGKSHFNLAITSAISALYFLATLMMLARLVINFRYMHVIIKNASPNITQALDPNSIIKYTRVLLLFFGTLTENKKRMLKHKKTPLLSTDYCCT